MRVRLLIFGLAVVTALFPGANVARAGCLSPPDEKTRVLSQQVGARPDLVLRALETTRPQSQSAEASAWQEAVRAEANDLLSQPADARRVAKAAMDGVERQSPVYVELLTRFAFNGLRMVEADDARPIVVRALQDRRPTEQIICLRAALGEIARIQKQADRAILELSAAYTLASQNRMPQQRMVAAEKLARVMGWGGDYNEAISLIDEVAAWNAAHSQSYSLANALYLRAVFQIQRGAFKEALQDLERSRITGSATVDVSGGAYIDLQICRVLIELGKVQTAEPRCLAAERVLVAAGDDTAGQAGFLLARIAAARGNPRAALRRLDILLAGAAARSASVQTTLALRLRSQVNAALGRPQAAFADLQAYVQAIDQERVLEREKQLLVQRARFNSERQSARNRDLTRDLSFAGEREQTQRRFTRIVLIAAAFTLLLLGTITLMALFHRRRLAALANLDSLTGIMNRRAITARAPKLIASSNQQGRPLALAILDLDHFKLINDRLGHGVGDMVLTRFAAIAATELRKTDLIARWGGEEFVVLLPGMSEHEVRAVFARLRVRLEGEEVVAADSLRIQFSAGVSFPGERTTFEAATARADVALYEAKRNGRNCTIVA